MTTIINNDETTTYTCECGYSRTFDNEYLDEYPIASRECWEAELREHCICPSGQQYTNLCGNTQISIIWTEEDIEAMRSVLSERDSMTSQFRSHTVATALYYQNSGWEFFNRPVYTLPNGEPEIWIEF
jgi:hypothetical protein